jgi:hypothetical protein
VPHVDPRFVIPVTLIALALFGVGLALGNVMGTDPSGTQTLTYTTSYAVSGAPVTQHGVEKVSVQVPPRTVTQNGKVRTLPGSVSTVNLFHASPPRTMEQLVNHTVTQVRNHTSTVRITVPTTTTVMSTIVSTIISTITTTVTSPSTS